MTYDLRRLRLKSVVSRLPAVSVGLSRCDELAFRVWIPFDGHTRQNGIRLRVNDHDKASIACHVYFLAVGCEADTDRAAALRG